MRNVPTKVNAVTSLDAEEYNQVQDDLENAVSTTGQVLDGFNPFQTAEAMARNAASATFYQDSGVADAYVLSTAGSFIVPAVYLDGALAVFKIGNDSTGPSTINFNGIGTKPLTLPDGSAISTEMIAGEYATTRYNLADDRVELVNVSESTAAAGVPTGTITWFAAATAPTGYLLCDGSEISRTTFAGLFAIIGVTYGIGDGSTTFDLPDLRGTFVRGVDDGTRALDPDSPRALGSEQAEDFLSHTHHIVTGFSDSGAIDKADIADGTLQGNIFTDPAGGNETRPVNIALNGIIKT